MLTQNTTASASSPGLLDAFSGSYSQLKEILSEDQIHFWEADLDRASAELAFPYLSDDEWSKARRFHFELHRNRFIAGRALLRLNLSSYFGCKPAEIAFHYNQWGKPSVPNSGLEFNVAHSENYFVLAVSREPVGVDIEKNKPIEDLYLIARTVFSPNELTAWSLLPEMDQVASFYKIWTRKEALLKGLGRGVTEFCPAISVLFVEGIPVLPASLSGLNWYLHDLQLTPGVAAALATPISNPHIVKSQELPQVSGYALRFRG